ncbi:MAG: hypothetical protein H6735_31405 [Alphaproteobacteria bacterium]|nr:hypothetical protein [Alphaproteobacteria bacterium]
MTFALTLLSTIAFAAPRELRTHAMTPMRTPAACTGVIDVDENGMPTHVSVVGCEGPAQEVAAHDLLRWRWAKGEPSVEVMGVRYQHSRQPKVQDHCELLLSAEHGAWTASASGPGCGLVLREVPPAPEGMTTCQVGTTHLDAHHHQLTATTCEEPARAWVEEVLATAIVAPAVETTLWVVPAP